jgi:hypothetical protein
VRAQRSVVGWGSLKETDVPALKLTVRNKHGLDYISDDFTRLEEDIWSSDDVDVLLCESFYDNCSGVDTDEELSDDNSEANCGCYDCYSYGVSVECRTPLL